jgi:antitoxin MazE
MNTKVHKWGNSLAVRIPKIVADEVGIYEETSVELDNIDGKIVISPSVKRKYELDTLLSKVKKNNIHRETDTDDPTGKEEW